MCLPSDSFQAGKTIIIWMPQNNNTLEARRLLKRISERCFATLLALEPQISYPRANLLFIIQHFYVQSYFISSFKSGTMSPSFSPAAIFDPPTVIADSSNSLNPNKTAQIDSKRCQKQLSKT